MKIRGRSYVRRRDVYHIELAGQGVNRFQEKIGFGVFAKAQKLADLVSLMSELGPGRRYEWFVSHYSRKGRKWTKASYSSTEGEKAVNG